MKGLVSIIIPSFNYGHLIIETLQSIIKQTYTRWECIIVDDGSTDDTTGIVQQFIEEYPQQRFTYLEVPNAGTSAAKNKGITLARGEFIQFLDADDLLSEEKLSVQMQIAEEQSAEVIFSKSIYFTGDAIQQNYIQKYPSGFLATESLKGTELLRRIITNNILTISSPLIKKELVIRAGMFDKDLKNNEDWLFWFKVALLSPSFTFDNNERSFILVRTHETSASNNQKRMFEGEVVVRQFIDQSLNALSTGDKTLLKKLNSDLLALHQVRSLNAIGGLNYIFLSFVKNPVKAFPLVKKGLFRLGTRIYKSMI
jgi:glycosyltransferase involved in cell wall biosynthesis